MLNSSWDSKVTTRSIGNTPNLTPMPIFKHSQWSLKMFTATNVFRFREFWKFILQLLWNISTRTEYFLKSYDEFTEKTCRRQGVDSRMEFANRKTCCCPAWKPSLCNQFSEVDKLVSYTLLFVQNKLHAETLFETKG